MAVIRELIRTESDGTLSFGDYTLAEKSKIEGYEFEGDSYKVKTFKEITKLEKAVSLRKKALGCESKVIYEDMYPEEQVFQK